MANTASENKDEMRLIGRKVLTLEGILDILAFDESFAELSTKLGILTVEGEGLHLEKSDIASGLLVLTGKIDAMIYTEDRVSKKKGLFKGRK